MNMAETEDVAKAFLNEVVLPIAFMGGVYRAIGTSPAGATKGALAELATSQYVQNWLAILGAASAMIFVAGIVASFLFGRLLGLASFGSAFASGWIVLSMPQMSMFLLIVSMVLAFIAPFVHGGNGRGRGGRPVATRR